MALAAVAVATPTGTTMIPVGTLVDIRDLETTALPIPTGMPTLRSRK